MYILIVLSSSDIVTRMITNDFMIVHFAFFMILAVVEMHVSVIGWFLSNWHMKQPQHNINYIDNPFLGYSKLLSSA